MRERKTYWKEGCLLLIGLILGYLSNNYSKPLPTTVVEKDTIVVHDTIYAKAIVPSLCEKNVIMELHKQQVPHPKIVLAQTKLESGHYKSRLSKTHNNILGIRKGKQYKKYENWTECIADYKKLISSKYKGGDYYIFLDKLGYAEDPSYIKLLKEMV